MSEIYYSRAWRTFADAAMFVLMHLTLKMDFQGLDNIPRAGPLLVIINHNSFLDPVIPCVFVRHDMFPIAKIEALEYRLGWMLKWYGVIPIRRGEGDPAALKRAFRVLKEGHALLMAPEGTRNPKAVLQEPHEGAALVAVRSGVPILPVAMLGGVPYLKNVTRLRRTAISMRVGAPLIVRALEYKPTRADHRAIAEEMMYALAALLPLELRGRYADVAQFAPRYLVPYNARATVQSPATKGMMPLTN